jgi:hypothetical protein
MTKKNFVKGEFIFEDNLRNDKLFTSKDSRTTGDGTINRTSDLITSIVVGGRTITINRDGDDVITSWGDGTYTWTPTRTDGVIVSWEVTTA